MAQITDIVFSINDRLALTEEEQKLLTDLLNAQDRGGFYMVYNAMTDTAESSLQSRISTFSGGVGGAALSANRLAQVEGGITVTPHLIMRLLNLR